MSSSLSPIIGDHSATKCPQFHGNLVYKDSLQVGGAGISSVYPADPRQCLTAAEWWLLNNSVQHNVASKNCSHVLQIPLFDWPEEAFLTAPDWSDQAASTQHCSTAGITSIHTQRTALFDVWLTVWLHVSPFLSSFVAHLQLCFE